MTDVSQGCLTCHSFKKAGPTAAPHIVIIESYCNDAHSPNHLRHVENDGWCEQWERTTLRQNGD
jgi:quinol monooxygenase YgiN